MRSALTKCVSLFRGKKSAWWFKFAGLSKMGISTNAFLVLASAMVVAIAVFRTLITCDWDLCMQFHLSCPSLPRTISSSNNVIVVSVGWPPQPITLILHVAIHWSCEDVWMPENPWANISAIYYFCRLYWRAKLSAIIFVLLNVLGIATMIPFFLLDRLMVTVFFRWLIRA